jgi:hypothetical protein
MPVVEIESLNLAANTSNFNVINGLRASQIDPTVRGAVIKLLAVASAAGLTHSIFVGSRNPLETSVVSVSATPQLLEEPENVVISGVAGLPNETIRLFVSEVAGLATTDYRARLVVSEL